MSEGRHFVYDSFYDTIFVRSIGFFAFTCVSFDVVQYRCGIILYQFS